MIKDKNKTLTVHTRTPHTTVSFKGSRFHHRRLASQWSAGSWPFWREICWKEHGETAIASLQTITKEIANETNRWQIWNIFKCSNL